MFKVVRTALTLSIGLGIVVLPILSIAQSNSSTGAVFIMTNNADKNEVIAFERAADGSLGESHSYDTEGRGSGGTSDPL